MVTRNEDSQRHGGSAIRALEQQCHELGAYLNASRERERAMQEVQAHLLELWKRYAPGAEWEPTIGELRSLLTTFDAPDVESGLLELAFSFGVEEHPLHDVPMDNALYTAVCEWVGGGR